MLKALKMLFYYASFKKFNVLIFLFLCTSLSSQTPSEVGDWSAPIPFSIVPVAAANLPDGRLITWASQFPATFVEVSDGTTFTQLFNPLTNAAFPATTSNTYHDMFCPGINNLADGRILSAGGATSDKTSIYNPQTGLWTIASNMNIPRGYQGNVTLSDGSVFTIGGSWSDGNNPASNGGKDAELWSPLTGWLRLPGIKGEDIFNANDLSQEDRGLYRVDNHVWLWPAPDGRLFHAGPGERMHWIDVSNGGTIEDAGQRGNDTYSMKGTTVMYDIGKILKVGGARSYDSDHPAKNNAFIIDINGTNPIVTAAPSLAESRTMHNSTVLPNGQVLVTGGLDQAVVFSDVGARFSAELYDPVANTWQLIPGMQVPRTYHSVAILLPDGRVFVGGGGLCDGTPGCVNHQNAEIYSPPYLFDSGNNLAVRPVINTVSSAGGTGSYTENIVAYNETISVTTSVPISEFSVIRFSSATHSTNNEQRRIPLTFTGSAGNYDLNIPDRNLLPPGFYMLFALDANGVPSESRTLRIGNELPIGQNDNLVLDLLFDEASGVTLADASQYNNNATVLQRDDTGQSVPATDHTFVPGVFGNALELDGLEHNSNSIIDIPYDSSFETAEAEITLMAWVWRDGGSVIAQTGRVANVGIFSHDYPAIFFGFHNTLYKWSFQTTGGFVDCYSGYAPLDGWNHIAATYDGKTARLFANGEEICSKPMTGSLVLRNDGSVYSSFTASGFYDDRNMPVVPYGNSSGLTDEVDGKIDALKVYNIALGEEEIRNQYLVGLAQSNPNIPDCTGNPLVMEYKIDDGAWTTNANNTINAQEGNRVYIRAQGSPGQYFITTPIIDGPTFNSLTQLNGEGAHQIDTNFGGGDGFISVTDAGQYVLTTAAGCPTTVQLNVIGNCDPEDTEISTEYQINNVWCDSPNGIPCGASEITINEGDRLVISALPNTLPGGGPLRNRITLPNGQIVNADYVIESADVFLHQGNYLIISDEGCSELLTVNVNEIDCAALGLASEYRINTGAYISGESEVVVDAGNTLTLSIIPNGIPFSVTSNSINGNNKINNLQDLILTNLEVEDSGTYTLTTASGCSEQITVTVNTADCNALNVRPEYQINGTGPYLEGSGQLVIEQGNTLTLSILPNGIPYSIASTSTNGNSKILNTADLILIGLTQDDAGMYTFTTASGCTVDLELIVALTDCTDVGLQPEYRINTGAYIAGESTVSVNAGDDLLLSVIPNTYNGLPLSFSISGPNTKPFNALDLTITTITPADAGTYTMTTGSGCVTALEVVVVGGPNQPPVAIASAIPLSGNPPLEVFFTGSNSTDDAGIVSYLWDFGDGNTAASADPVYSYTTLGSYTVTLTVTDAEGLQNDTSLTIDVNDLDNQPPMAVIAANPTSGPVPLTVSFNSGGSYDDVGIESYFWDFKNGTTSTEANPVATFTAEGVYEVTLTVTDAQGLNHTASITITANAAGNIAPTAVIGANPQAGIAPLEVSFTASGSTDDVGIVSFAWDFGDGNSSTTTNPVHTFTEDGSYTVSLTVTDSEGLSDTATLVINIGEGVNMPPVAVASGAPLTGTTPLRVIFSGGNSSDDSEVVSYAWDFGDGNTSTLANPVNTFVESGIYNVTLTVTDAEGLTATTSLTVTVEEGGSGTPEVEILIAPNPASTIANLFYSNSDAAVLLEKIGLFDSGGRLIYTFVPEDILNTDHYEIPINTLRDGMYYVKLNFNTGKPVGRRLLVKN